MRKKIVVGAIIAIVALIIWVIPLAPQKDVVVITKEIAWNGGTTTAYCVYYVWDGVRERYPWWTIFQSPLHDFEWIVLETADIDDVHDPDSVAEAVARAARFTQNWFDDKLRYVQRTRLEKLLLAFFGNEDLPQEREAIGQIVDSIHKTNNLLPRK